MSAVGPQATLDELPLGAEESQTRFSAVKDQAQIHSMVARYKSPLTYSIIRVTLENPLLLVSNGLSGEAKAP